MSLIPFSEIQAAADRIVDRFHPEQIILFGSYAYGEPNEDSDVDLLVIMPIEEDSWMFSAQVGAVAHEGFHHSLDVVVKTKERAIKGYEEFDPILRPALSKGKILYDGYP